MVELAKRLGHDARVGALQGNFGTPYENGIAALQAELDEARAAAAEDPEAAERVAELEAKLAEATRSAKPGRGDDDWASIDLDVNRDGQADPADLAALGGDDSPSKDDLAESPEATGDGSTDAPATGN
jgi:ABC-type nitrate/sulfonate/bicarbonate transport system substrate-binding protein